MMNKLVMILLLFVSGLSAQQKNTVNLLNAQTFKDAISTKKVQLIDVRTPREYASGHINDAKNIDFFASNFSTEFNKLDKTKPVYIYCQSGGRSSQSAKKLTKMGFVKVYDLKGGILHYD